MFISLINFFIALASLFFVLALFQSVRCFCLLFSWSFPNSCFRRNYYGMNDWMPQIPEGIGHGSQRDIINSCFYARWPWPGPCGEEPLYYRHHTDVWAKQDDFAIHFQGPQGGRKTTVRRSNARRDAPRYVGFAHRKRNIVPLLRVHASYYSIPWMRRTKHYGHLMSITREREQLAASETRLSSYGTSSKEGLSWPLCFFERANCTRRQLSFTLCSVNFTTQIQMCKHPWTAKFPVQLSHACANETVPASRSWHPSPRGTNLAHGPNGRHGGPKLSMIHMTHEHAMPVETKHL